ncbi:TPA: tRNA 4-thiouridine(8) synthase ThiI [Candidatus Micrarchaeota archaeon]|nr:tRNA 4-thiouridine(8) synthase ThiI [Candidatus Micrarchaeota archaeon]
MNSGRTKPLFVIHFGEIGLKGNNRPDFEARLVENIRKSLVGEDFEKIFRTESRIILYTNEKSDLARIAEKLQKIFGIEWFALAHETDAEIENIKKAAWGLRDNIRGTVKVDTSRSDKRFPMKSMEVNKVVGEVFHESGKYKIDVKTPETVIGIEILNKIALIYFNKIRGVGGLPVGCTGKVVCLLSGGIDSPVAAWMMMKRGCIVEFVHAYAQANVDEVKNSKMADLIAVLKQYNCGSKMKLHAIPYSAFYGASFSMPHKKELVLFRRFLLKVANRIAAQNFINFVRIGNSIEFTIQK